MPRMTGNRYFAEAMRGYGVTHLFYVTSIMDPAMVEIAKLGVTRVVTHGEKAAAYMADGYARASRRPGVCLAQDVGSTNLAAGLRDAHMAHSPVIAITGGQSELLRYRNAYQNAEDFSAWNGVTKANFSVDTVGRFPDLLRQAFRVATTGAPGPVHLELRGHTGQMMDGEADLDLVFERQFAQYPALRPEADEAAIRAALAALDEAAKPIIVVGGGAVASGAGSEVVALAERLSIPIATSLNARALVPDDHPLGVGVPGSYSRWCANRSVAAADLVFFIGSSTGSQVTNNYAIPRLGTRAIQLDIDPEELGRTYPNVVSLCGDVRLTLRKMIAAIGERPRARPEWLEQVRGYVADYWAESEPLKRSDARPMRPRAVVQRARGVASGGRDPGGRYVSRGDLDGTDHAHETRTALYPLRRLARLGVPGNDRCESRPTRATGDRFRRRCRLLLSPRGAGNRGARGARHRHGGQQQLRRRREGEVGLPAQRQFRADRAIARLRGISRRAPARRARRARQSAIRRTPGGRRSHHGCGSTREAWVGGLNAGPRPLPPRLTRQARGTVCNPRSTH